MVKEGLLFVSYYFPPTKSIASVRHFNHCSEFIHTFNVHILTTSNAHKFRKDNYPRLDISSQHFLLTLDPRTFISQKPLKSKIKTGNFSDFIYRLLNSFPFNICLGIGGLIYIIHGYLKGVSLIKKNNIKTIYSSYFPYSDHVICYLLKRKFTHLKWIADFRDLHYNGTTGEVLFLNLQDWFNRKILKSATIITTVSAGLQRHLSKYNHCIVIKNSIGNLNKSLLGQIPEVKLKKFTISYTGNLIPDRSKPDLFFSAVKYLNDKGMISANDFEIKYAGSYNEYWEVETKRYGIEKFCSTQGLVSLQDSYSIQKHSALNLLLSFNSPQVSGILTGKFYEYLASENPILLIINGSKDQEFEKIFEDLNCGEIFYHNEDNSSISSFIHKIYSEWKTRSTINWNYNHDALENYTTKSQIDFLRSQLVHN